MSGGEVVLVALAGLACGAVNALAGGGSLLLFPALLATGMGTLAANVTNSVSTWPGYIGSTYGFRAEVGQQRHRLVPLLGATVVGSVTGCVLLLVTPVGAFDKVVPVLVLAAAALLAIQPSVARRAAARATQGSDASVGEAVTDRSPRLAHLAAIFGASVYGGYFGAALGVIFLAVLGLMISEPLRRLNGLKAVLSLLDASVSLVVFGLFGPVHWSAVAVAAPAALAGGYLGARLARKVDDEVLRNVVVVFAVIVAVYLAARAYGPL